MKQRIRIVKELSRPLKLWGSDDKDRPLDNNDTFALDDWKEATLEWYREYFDRHYPYFGQGGTS